MWTIALIIVYCYTAFMWASFAVKMDNVFNTGKKSVGRDLIVFCVNLVGCPISITIALLNMHIGSYDPYFKTPRER